MKPRHPAVRVTVALGSAALALVVAACGGRPVPPPAGDPLDADALQACIADRLDAIESVRVRATLEYYGDDGRARIRQALVAQAPADVRMEAISPFDTTLSVLVLRDGGLRFYDLQNEQFVVGRAVPEHIGRLIPLWLTAEDIVRVMLGAPPLDAASPTEAGEVSWDGSAGAWRWRMSGVTGGELDVWVRHERCTFAGAHARDAAGTTTWELRTGSYETRDVDGTPIELPTRYRFLLPAERIDISLEVERRTLNPDLPEELFELAEPRGVERIDLDSLR